MEERKEGKKERSEIPILWAHALHGGEWALAPRPGLLRDWEAHPIRSISRHAYGAGDREMVPIDSSKPVVRVP